MSTFLFRSLLPLVALTSAAGAESPPPAPPTIVTASADVLDVVGDRIIYEGSISSAMKTDTPLVDTPQSVSVLTGDFLAEQSFRPLSDVTRYTPGVLFGQGEGHRDAPTIRGNSSTADFYLDGVRDDVEYFRDLYNVDRVEVLKGPNALIFGRGGGGGVINRVSKEASFDPENTLTLIGGSFAFGRATLDAGVVAADDVALRLNALYENSDSFRDFVGIERIGANPTATWRLTPSTTATLGYEYYRDQRDVDRGVPSQNGRPFRGDRSAFFGNPSVSQSEIEVNALVFSLEHAFSETITLKNRTRVADYNKAYANVYANSPVQANGDVRLQSYRSLTERENLFSQTDLLATFDALGAEHRLLFGVEAGVQKTDNFRTENNNAVGVVTIASPTTFAPPFFIAPRNDNDVRLTTASAYLQDQIAFGERIILVGGVRFDRFDLEFDDRRAVDADAERVDETFSPRGGVIVKPAKNASFYVSYSQSFLPQSGDQFASLDATAAALEPERFEVVEAGVKWDLTPALAATAAVYRLDRDNTRAIDPLTNLTVLTGAQRSRGLEVALVGKATERWETLLGYALQDAEITRTTAAAPAGRAVPLVPRHQFSAWNRYQITDQVAASLGVTHQSEVFASISNAVVLPAYTRVDAAAHIAINDRLAAHVALDNIFNAIFFPTAHNDNNISVGTPRAIRVSLTAGF